MAVYDATNGKSWKVSVTERDKIFQAGKSAQNHAVEKGAVTAAKIISTVQSKELEDKFKPASAIVNVWFQILSSFYGVSINIIVPAGFWPRRPKPSLVQALGSWGRA